MSYLTFHLVFTIPQSVVLAWTLPRPLEELGGRRAKFGVPLIATIAFIYTTPWDNYLVARAVWWYGPDRVIGTLGAVPIEEYFFFLIQPILTGYVGLHYLMRFPKRQGSSSAAAWGGVTVFAGLSAIGCLLLMVGPPQTLYAALILGWACPLLAGMWLYDGETLWGRRNALFYTVGIPTLYLWIADAVAIRQGIWTISEQHTIGLSLFGLPFEEALFFLLTNLLVVQGLILLLYGSHDAFEQQAHSTSEVFTKE